MFNSAEAEQEGGGTSTEKYSFGLNSDEDIYFNEESELLLLHAEYWF